MTLPGVVHALEQAHRRLYPGGKVLVLIPCAYRPAVVRAGRPLGRIDDRPFRPAIRAVELGVARVVAEGLFRPIATRTLETIDRYANGSEALAAAHPTWRLAPGLVDALLAAVTPVEVHKRSLLKVLV